MTNAYETAAAERVEQLEREWNLVNGKINDLYWIFTRSARGRPPAVVAPDLYGRRAELERELRQHRRAAKVSVAAPALTARWWRAPGDRHLSRAEYSEMKRRPHFNLSEIPRGDHPDVDDHVAWWIEHGLRTMIEPLPFRMLDPQPPLGDDVIRDVQRSIAAMPAVMPLFIVFGGDEDL